MLSLGKRVQLHISRKGNSRPFLLGLSMKPLLDKSLTTQEDKNVLVSKVNCLRI